MNSLSKHSFIINVFQLLVDFVILTILFFVFLFIHLPDAPRSFESIIEFSKDHYKAIILILVSWVFISSYTKLYYKFLEERFIDFIRRLVLQIFLFSIILFAISGIKSESLFTNEESFYFLSTLLFLSFLSQLLIFYTIKYFKRTGKIVKERILIVGRNSNSESFLSLIKNQSALGILVEKNLSLTECEYEIHSLNKILKKELVNERIDSIYIALGGNLDDEKVNAIIKIAEENFIKVKYLYDSFIDIQSNLDIVFVDTFPIFTYKKFPLDYLSSRVSKRIFDLAFTVTIFIFILWWLLPLLSIAVYASQGSPILFKQKRNGLNGKEFNCLKFRTMNPHKFNDIKPTERDDPRVTKLGKILRKTSLDELPQFINVLKGEMSIVGPRPHMVSENEAYSEIIKRYSLRHYVKPGITGLAQIKGYRGAVDTDKDMEMRIRTDIYYVRNWSFLLDLFIIYKTGKLMIFGDENAI